MSLNILTLLKGVKEYIHENNTTTSGYDISDGLHRRVATILYGFNNMSDSYPLSEPEYPAIFVELVSDIEEYAILGRADKRDINLKFNIVAITDWGMGVTKQASIDENLTLTQNISHLLRQNSGRMSDVADFSVIDSADYGIRYSNDTWNIASRMNLNVRKRS